MKKYVLSLAIVSALLFVTTNIQAQSWADLFKKENIEKVVNAVTGNNAIDMTGCRFSCREQIERATCQSRH